MILNILYKLPIYNGVPVYQRIKNIIMIAIIVYICIYALLYSKLGKDIPMLSNVRKYMEYIIGADIIIFGLLAKFLYKIDIIDTIAKMISGEEEQTKQIIYVKNANNEEPNNEQPKQNEDFEICVNPLYPRHPRSISV